MFQHSPLIKVLAILTCSFLSANPSIHAEEGAAGHYLPGASATLIDLVPTKPGWVFETVYLRYEGDASLSRSFPISGLLATGIDATSQAFLIGGFYTFEKKILGAYYSVGTFLPYVWADVRAQVDLSFGELGRSLRFEKRDRANGLGDIAFMPFMMAWEIGDWQIHSLFPIYAPTGSYKTGRLANPGLNHWTFDPVIGGAYNNEKLGFNAAIHMGVAFSTENNKTNYRNGSVFHLEGSIQQLLPLGPGFIGVGVEGFYYNQVSGDSGAGARRGGFKSRITGVGPVLSYVLPVKDNTLVAEIRWLTELDTTNRLQGDYLWVKMIYQF